MEEFGHISALMRTLAYSHIYSAQIILYTLGRCENGGRADLARATKLQSALNLFKAFLQETATKEAVPKCRKQLLKMAKVFEETEESHLKSKRLLEASLSQLELFDEVYEELNAADYEQMQRDANYMIAMNLLYLYDAVLDPSTIGKTHQFLNGLTGKEVHPNISKVVEAFYEKANTM